MTVKQVAAAATMDAPAATVAVNDLEERGLVRADDPAHTALQDGFADAMPAATWCTRSTRRRSGSGHPVGLDEAELKNLQAILAKLSDG
jgi:hypothetical protein